MLSRVVLAGRDHPQAGDARRPDDVVDFGFATQHLAQARLERQLEQPVRRGAAQVAVDQQRPAAATRQAGGQLAGDGRLSFAVQGARDHDHAHRLGDGAVNQVRADRVDRFDQQPVQIAVGGGQGLAAGTRDRRQSADDAQAQAVDQLRRGADPAGLEFEEGHGQSHHQKRGEAAERRPVRSCAGTAPAGAIASSSFWTRGGACFSSEILCSSRFNSSTRTAAASCTFCRLLSSSAVSRVMIFSFSVSSSRAASSGHRAAPSRCRDASRSEVQLALVLLDLDRLVRVRKLLHQLVAPLAILSSTA